MGHESDIKCPTPKCVERAAKYNRTMVFNITKPPTFMPDAIARCEGCGGYTNGTEWKHICEKCGKAVEPGKLCGLFVPHLCGECEQSMADRDRATGNICFKCHSPRSRCCC